MGRRVAIVATGQTKHQSRREDVSMMEMIYEAAAAALADAEMKVSEIDAVILANMELFEGRALPEMWCAMGAGGLGKHCWKIATGGTSGSSGAIAGFHHVASGLFDTAMVIGFEKQSDGHTTAGMALTDPMWDRHVAAAAIGNFAVSISQYVAARGVTEEQAAKVAVKARRNACKNPQAHLHLPDITVEEVLASPYLAHPIHRLEMCPTTDGACAVIFAGEGKAERLCPRPAWVRAAVTRHDFPYLGDLKERLVHMRTLRHASRKAYEKVGIKEPLKELDVAELYEPVTYAELAWYECLGFCPDGEAGRLIDDGVTAMDGELPVNPSGGVLSTNPIGASGTIRVAEAALQIHGRGGDRQVPDVKLALATGYGVYSWSDVMILSSAKG
ncbi:MAG: thiolase family protein [Proteobacteria bacterium]|nr:thiolase family protein [Pseudomonadota bacterium]MBU1742786.1 thiolase family protein [Pseudomonadota bacterium]